MDIAEINRRCLSGESFLMASDGQYLGKLCLNKFDAESILNEYGAYGSRYSNTSIYNQYSMYGSQYSSLSPFNLYTSTPPVIYLRGIKCGFLSINNYLMGAIDPRQIQSWMQYNGLYY